MHCSVLRSWVEAEKLCAEEGLQLATPHSREDVKARALGAGSGDRKMGRSGPIGKQGPIWVRKYLGPGRCRFSWGYFLIEWKYMGDAKEKMANGYPPMVGSLPSRPCPGESFHIISQAISMNVQMVTIVYHCPRKKTYNPSYPTKRGYSTQLYPIYIYIPIYYY
jgi:hypothetical protein